MGGGGLERKLKFVLQQETQMSLGKSRILAENLTIQSRLYSDMGDESESDVDQVIVEDNDEAQKEGIALQNMQ